MRIVLVVFIALTSLSTMGMNEEKPLIWKSPRVERAKNYGAIVNLVREKNIKKLEELFSEKCKENGWGELLNQVGENGLTPLQIALDTLTANPDIIEALLKRGANPNLGLKRKCHSNEIPRINLYKGWTAGHFAVRMKASSEILDYLLSYQCDFWQADARGWTPITLAIAKKLPALEFLSGSMVNDYKERDDLVGGTQEGEDGGRNRQQESINGFDPRDGREFRRDIAAHHNSQPLLNFTNMVMLFAVLYYGLYC